jgi:hypothetical protein
MVQRYLHDCEYAGIEAIHTGIKQSMKLRQNLYKYKHVIPKKEEHINAVPLFKSDDNREKDKSVPSTSTLNKTPPTREPTKLTSITPSIFQMRTVVGPSDRLRELGKQLEQGAMLVT